MPPLLIPIWLILIALYCALLVVIKIYCNFIKIWISYQDFFFSYSDFGLHLTWDTSPICAILSGLFISTIDLLYIYITYGTNKVEKLTQASGIWVNLGLGFSLGQVRGVNLMLTEPMKKYQSLMQHLPIFSLVE